MLNGLCPLQAGRSCLSLKRQRHHIALSDFAFAQWPIEHKHKTLRETVKRQKLHKQQKNTHPERAVHQQACCKHDASLHPSTYLRSVLHKTKSSCDPAHPLLFFGAKPATPEIQPKTTQHRHKQCGGRPVTNTLKLPHAEPRPVGIIGAARGMQPMEPPHSTHDFAHSYAPSFALPQPVCPRTSTRSVAAGPSQTP